MYVVVRARTALPPHDAPPTARSRALPLRQRGLVVLELGGAGGDGDAVGHGGALLCIEVDAAHPDLVAVEGRLHELARAVAHGGVGYRAARGGNQQHLVVHVVAAALEGAAAGDVARRRLRLLGREGERCNLYPDLKRAR